MKKLSEISLLLILIILSSPESWGDEPLHQLELILHTIHGPSELRFNIETTSAKVWEAHRTGDYFVYLTNESKYIYPDAVVMSGSYSRNDKGWNTDKWPKENPQPPILGRGTYQITVFAENDATMDTLIVNCYGTNFLFQGIDCIVTYDFTGNNGNGAFYHNDQEITEIQLYNQAEIGLQPTAPRNFRCSNYNQIGAYPYFNWSPPSHPEITASYFRFKIYRKEGDGSFICVASNISSTSWTDQTVTIGSYGTLFTYKATAHTTSSPESDPSALAIIRANPHKVKPDEFNDSDIVAEDGLNYQLDIYPNPFNPATHIFYTIPEPTQARLSVSNISGQEIAELVNEYKNQGKYSTNFNGQSLAGGIYLVRLLTKDQQVTQKILLLK